MENFFLGLGIASSGQDLVSFLEVVILLREGGLDIVQQPLLVLKDVLLKLLGDEGRVPPSV